MKGSCCTKRLEAIKKEARLRNIDAFFISSPINVSYLSFFKGHDAMILVTPGKSFFLTDSRYAEEAKNTIKGLEVEVVTASTYETLKSIIKKTGLSRIGFESMDMPYGAVERMKEAIPDIAFVPIKDMVESLRAVKDAEEIGLIKRSISLTQSVLAKTMPLVKPGVSEEEIAKNIELEFIKNGARPSFESIIASGANSSKPHAIPGKKLIAKDSYVMIDIGCSLDGYNSDMTRMLLTGQVSDKFKKIYNIVNDARLAAIDAIKPGVRSYEIDRVGRGYIDKRGFGKYFSHSLGHGVGMEVHEQPSISKLNESLLKPGMVFTIEPAIYIPKLGGVRIEDMVLVTDKGREVLTK